MSQPSCATPENYAAIALRLQSTALGAEQRIYELERQLHSAVNPPTVVQTNANAITGLPTGTVDWDIGPFAAGKVTIFNNTGYDFAIDGETIQYTQKLGAGLYEAGMYCNVIASGAVSDNTFRYFKVSVNRLEPSGVREVAEASLLLFESNTGVGTDACVVGIFRLEGNEYIRFTMRHDNIASTMNIPLSPPPLFWLTKISDLDVLEVI